MQNSYEWLIKRGTDKCLLLYVCADLESEFKFRLLRAYIFENIASTEKPNARHEHDPNYRYEGRIIEPNFGSTEATLHG